MLLLPFVLITHQYFSLQLKDMPTQGKGFWKFNNSLTSNDDYICRKNEKPNF